MPKTKFEEIIFTLIMVLVMVYAMICYNIALNTGEMSYSVFLSACHELVIMAPVAFIFDFLFVGKIAKSTTFKIINPNESSPFQVVLAISAVSVIWMCPLMSLVATVLFKNAGIHLIPVWFQTIVMNFPMAFFWQICYAGPLVRFIFRFVFRRQHHSSTQPDFSR